MSIQPAIAISRKGDESLALEIVELLSRFSSHRKRQLALILLLMACGSVAELVSIGVIFPFLVALTSPASLFANETLRPLLQVLHVRSPDLLVLLLTFLVVASALLSNLLRLFVTYVSVRFGYAAGTDLSVRIFATALHAPYATHVGRNSSVTIDAILVKANSVIHGVLMPLMVLSNAILVLGAVALLLVIARPEVAATVFLVALVTYGVIYQTTKRRLATNSKRIAMQSVHSLRTLQEGLGGIREVLLEGTQDVYVRQYQQSDIAMKKAQAENAALGVVPRYVMEFIGISALAVVAFFLTNTMDNFAAVVPTLGLLAMGAQRSLPYLQQAAGSWMGIAGNRAALTDTLALLKEGDLPRWSAGVAPVSFAHTVELRDVGFQYQKQGPQVLHRVNLVVQRGSRIGVVGGTGNGKSTLLDILMGLLEPSQGELLVDGVVVSAANRRGWQAHIAHVPQSIFLLDASIEENIALGVPEEDIDRGLLAKVARQAQIHEDVMAMPQGYRTRVGERGAMLSGGQRQRIGIARALYKQADVILLDEATSALDSQTETAVMAAIGELGRELTLFVIAHRLATLQHCDEIIEISDARIHRRGTYASIVLGQAEKI